MRKATPSTSHSRVHITTAHASIKYLFFSGEGARGREGERERGRDGERERGGEGERGRGGGRGRGRRRALFAIKNTQACAN